LTNHAWTREHRIISQVGLRFGADPQLRADRDYSHPRYDRAGNFKGYRVRAAASDLLRQSFNMFGECSSSGDGEPISKAADNDLKKIGRTGAAKRVWLVAKSLA
jgi:hypothetical protein